MVQYDKVSHNNLTSIGQRVFSQIRKLLFHLYYVNLEQKKLEHLETNLVLIEKNIAYLYK